MAETNPAAPARVRTLPNDIHVVETAAGAILVNCPPETLKYLLAEGVPVPKIIVLPPDLPTGRQLGSSGFVRQGINYASVEFPLYSNFFVGGGQHTQLVTITSGQARRLRRILEETIDGPNNPRDYRGWEWLQPECSAVGYYPPLKRAPRVGDLARFASLDQAGGDLGQGVTVEFDADHFIFREAGAEVARVSTRIRSAPMPLSLAPPYPVLRHEITLQFIGGSDGFDPAGITTCFLAYVGATGHSQATLFDCAAYLRVRLGNLGISPSQISEVVLSHLHEDHVAGLPELLLMGERRVRLLTSGIIYASLLRVLSAMLDVPEAEVGELFDFYPLDPGRPVMLEGRRFQSIYAVHSIPTLAVRVNDLCYSGDMRYDETWFEELEAQGLLSPGRRAELVKFAEGTSVLVQDAGGGAVHTTLTPELLQSLSSKSRRVVLAHTSKRQLPQGNTGLLNAGGVEFAGSGHVTGVGAEIPRDVEAELVESLSACPLFARLSAAERVDLADQVTRLKFAPGEAILRQGDPFNGLTYVVHTGLVEVQKSGRTIRMMGRGNSIGERGALHGEARTVTLLAHGPVELLGLTMDVFGPIAESLGLPAAFERADWLWNHPTFGHLAWATLLDLALDFQPRRLAAGTQLFSAGDEGYECFLLIAGAINIISRDGELLGQFNTPGEFFGGRAALFGTPRNASARVEADSEVWALPAPALHRLQTIYPNVMLHLRLVEANRLGQKPLISSIDMEPLDPNEREGPV